MQDKPAESIAPREANVLISGDKANLRYAFNNPLRENILKIVGVKRPVFSIEQMVLRHTTGSQEIDLIDLLPKDWRIVGNSLPAAHLSGEIGEREREKMAHGWGVLPSLKAIHLGELTLLPPEEQKNVPE